MTPVPDEEGNVSFFHAVSVNSLVARKWREVIGQALAAMMEYPSTGSKQTLYSRIHEALTACSTRRAELGTQRLA